jgi:LCP family protein required for cell wall assembly
LEWGFQGGFPIGPAIAGEEQVRHRVGPLRGFNPSDNELTTSAIYILSPLWKRNILTARFLLPSSFRLTLDLLKGSLFLPGSSIEDLDSSGGQINILLLGAGGEEHQGHDLTDTIIFFSVSQKGEDGLMISLPRDIWIPSLRAKLNTAYHYGEEKKPGGGLILARSAVSEILDQPVHYAFLIDFDGFTKAIDLLGGIEVEVERTFDDYKYPIPGKGRDPCDGDPEYACRYEHIHFDAGAQNMDGKLALKYVRSRYAEGEEGSDFARSKRQQRLISAFKKKLFSLETILNLKKVEELATVFENHFDTDIAPETYAAFFKLALKFEQKNLRFVVLDGLDEEDGLLTNPEKSQRYDFQWVLTPRADTWQEVQEWVASLIQS